MFLRLLIILLVFLIQTLGFASEKYNMNIFSEYNFGVYDKAYYTNTNFSSFLVNYLGSIKTGIGILLFDNVIVKIDYQKFYNLNFKYNNEYKNFRKRTIRCYYDHEMKATLLGFNILLKVTEFNNILTYISYGIGVSDIQNGSISVVTNEVGQVTFNKKSYATGIDTKHLFGKLGICTKYNINDKLDFNIISYEIIRLSNIYNIYKGDDEILTSRLKIHSITSGITLKF